ncbi:MAG TPA: RIP metalloprotease RseP [Gemmatimonadales bacterium]|nr:RIP metalloprotease RseP [Gemmatimonadales bacterium]
MLLTVGAVVVVLGVLIFVHEMGHFVAAKTLGIQVLRFSLGFGRPIVSWRRGETEYWISRVPLGGYVKMAGLEDEGMAGSLEGGKSDVPVDPARAFDRQPVWKRTIVIVAGVTMNVVFAFLVYTGIIATVGSQERGSTRIDSVNVGRLPQGAEALASLKFGDQIVRVNGDTIRSWDVLLDHLVRGPTNYEIAVAGRLQPLVVRLSDHGVAARQALAQALVPLEPPRLGLLEPGRPAIRAGLKPGDLLLRANGDTLRSWGDVLHVVWNNPKRPLQFDVLRDGETLRVTVTPEEKTETDTGSPRPHVYGAIGAGQDPPTIHVREPLGQAVIFGFQETWGQVLLILGYLKGLVLHETSVRDVGSIITVGQISGQVARLGLDWFLRFLALFSVNLAILNLLPIPLLDGGQLVFLIAEAVRRKPLSLELRARLTQVGFVVLLLVMILALTNDVLRIIPH